MARVRDPKTTAAEASVAAALADLEAAKAEAPADGDMDGDGRYAAAVTDPSRPGFMSAKVWRRSCALHLLLNLSSSPDEAVRVAVSAGRHAPQLPSPFFVSAYYFILELRYYRASLISNCPCPSPHPWAQVLAASLTDLIDATRPGREWPARQWPSIGGGRPEQQAWEAAVAAGRQMAFGALANFGRWASGCGGGVHVRGLRRLEDA